MEHRVGWTGGRLGIGARRILDAQVFDAPLSRTTPAPDRLVRGAPGAAGQRAEGMERVELSDLIEDMDRAGVDASLVVLREKTDEFFCLAAQHPGRLFGSAYYDSLSHRRGLEHVQGLCNGHPDLILGVTTAMPRVGQDPRLRDFVPLYEFCAERGLPVQFCTAGDPAEKEADRPMAFAVLARSYPQLQVVCRYSRAWRGEELGLLHRVANLFLQVDGLALHNVLGTVGSRKLLFGSEWRGREDRYFARVEGVRRLSWWHRHNVGRRTAARVYGPRILCPPARIDAQPASR